MPVGLAVPMSTSGRATTVLHAVPMTTRMAATRATASARRQAPAPVLRREDILDALAPQLEQGFHPAPLAVVRHAARIVGRDHAIAARAHDAPGRGDLLLAHRRGHEADLSPA